MPRIHFKHLLAAGAIVGSLGYLSIAGYRAGVVYYLSVDQVLSQQFDAHSRVRVHGVVAQSLSLPDSMSAQGLQAGRRIELHGQAGVLTVDYLGTVPDGCAVGREVVVEGVRDEPGHLTADVLMTKCATKYQAAEGTR